MIEPDPNWYGGYARRSALADYLELSALIGRPLTESQLADLIRDAGWTRLLGTRIRNAATGEEEPDDVDDIDLPASLDDAQMSAEGVLAIARARSQMLGTNYPFELVGEILLRHDGSPPSESPYVALLCITVGHVLGVNAADPPYRVFEDSVTELLSSRGWPTANLGNRERNGEGFQGVLRDSANEVGLVANPDAAPYRVFAHDEGTDTLSNLWTLDRRIGGLHIVGQVTCGRSESWERKIDEPKPGQWEAWLGRFRTPDIFLAVPHHVEPPHLQLLIQGTKRDVLDRIRIAGVKHTVLEREGNVIEAVLSLARAA